MLAFTGTGNNLSGTVTVSGGTLAFQGTSVSNFTATGDGRFIVNGSAAVVMPEQRLGNGAHRPETGD